MMKGFADIRVALVARRKELDERLDRIKANLTRPKEADSADRAQALENAEVVDALGNDAYTELQEISRALARIDVGTYDRCEVCGESIPMERLQAYPLTTACIDCAEARER